LGAPKRLKAGRKVEDEAREVGVSKHTNNAWKARYGGMDASEAEETKRLLDKNRLLRELVAESELGQRSLPVGDPKRRLGLVAWKAAIRHMRKESFSGRLACECWMCCL